MTPEYNSKYESSRNTPNDGDKNPESEHGTAVRVSRNIACRLERFQKKHYSVYDSHGDLIEDPYTL